ncbi:hypothetical protein HYU14_01045 [Candidatus Woesearchaeota archaeon]|nr:hypothetical protein [Candidatus Woesearchaeota archaeon]
MQRKKRGTSLAWNKLMEFILGALVLGVVVYIAFPEAYKGGKEVFSKGLTAIGIDGKVEFTPYVPQFTPTEQTIDYSMNALMCAIKGTQYGVIDTSYCTNLGGKQIPVGSNPIQQAGTPAGAATSIANPQNGPGLSCEGGILFGTNQCVKCESDTLVFLEGDMDNDISQLSKALIDCKNKYGSQNKRELCGLIDFTGMRNNVAKILKIGYFVSDTQIQLKMGGASRGIKWDLKDGEQGLRFRNGGKALIYWDGAYIDNFLITDKLQAPSGCKLIGFEMPQEIPDNWKNYIVGYGDPEHLVYFEKFPELEKMAWKTKDQFWFMIGLGVRGLFTLVPFVPGIAKAALSEAKNAGNIAVKETMEAAGEIGKRVKTAEDAQDALQTINKFPSASSVAKLSDAISKADNLLLPMDIDKLASEATERMVNTIKKSTIAGTESQGGEALFKISAHNQKRASKEVSDFFARELKSADMDEQILRKNIEDMVNFQPGQRAAKRVNKAQLENAIKRSFEQSAAKKGISGTIDEAFKKAVERNGLSRFFNTLFNSGKLLKARESIVDAFNAVAHLGGKGKITAQETFKYVGERAKNLHITEDMLGLVKAAPQEAREIIDSMPQIGESFAVALVRDLKPLKSHIAGGAVWAKNSLQKLPSCVAIGVAIIAAGQVSELLDQTVPFLGLSDSTEMTAGIVAVGGLAPFFLGKATVGCYKFLKYNYVPAFLGAAYLFYLEESQNQAFIPIGMNKLGVVEPMYYETKPRVYEPEIPSMFYFNMKKEKGQAPERFFLASPCKVDLQLTKDYCSCELNNGDFAYEFEDSSLGKNQAPEKRLQTIEPLRMEGVWRSDWEKVKNDKFKKFQYLTYVPGSVGSTAPNWINDPSLNFRAQMLKLFKKHDLLAEDLYNKKRTEFLSFLFNDPPSFFLFIASSLNKDMPNKNQEKISLLKKLSPILDLDQESYELFLKILSENLYADLTISERVFLANIPYYAALVPGSIPLAMGYEVLKSIFKTQPPSLKAGPIELSKPEKELIAEILERRLFGERINARQIRSPLQKNFLELRDKSLESFKSKFIKGDNIDSYRIDWEELKKEFPDLTTLFGNQKPLLDDFIKFDKNLMQFEEKRKNEGTDSELNTLENGLDTLFNDITQKRIASHNRRSLYLENALSKDFNIRTFEAIGDEAFLLQTLRLLHSEYFEKMISDFFFRVYTIDQNTPMFKESITRICRNQEFVQAPAPSQRFNLKRKTTIPCFSAEPQNIDKYGQSGWNGGYNYCYTGRSLFYEFSTSALEWTSIIAGIALTPFSGGAIIPLILAGTEIASMFGAYILEECGTWPTHAPSVSGCFT